MIKMAQIEHIKKMYHSEGLSIREISRIYGHHLQGEPLKSRYRMKQEVRKYIEVFYNRQRLRSKRVYAEFCEKSD